MSRPPGSARRAIGAKVPLRAGRCAISLGASFVLWLVAFAWSEPAGVRAVVLGVAQDGGLPHIGCTQQACVQARRDPALRERVAALGLVDAAAGKRFLIDATPDLPSQLESLQGGTPPHAPEDRRRPLDGILLTHAHVGHYAGLMYLGREALGAQGVPVFATPRMARFLRDNAPWSQLVALGNIELRELEPERELSLTSSLRVTARRVPHRDEQSDTVGFVVRGPRRSLLYLPDIDKWERWERPLEDEVASVDLALLDGTFAAADEVPGRSIAEIPHPLVAETMARLRSRPALGQRVLFIHLNHSNPLLWDPARRRELAPFRIARDGEEHPL
jgi:pyrroloquinoline quinone biosynthesis protein B